MAASTMAQSHEFRPPANGPVPLLERPQQPTVERPSAPLKPKGEEPGAGEKARKGFLRRRSMATALGLVFLAFAGAGGYLYWDYAGHFESTDDAFIAARQFSIEPHVAGYITAVPVTDNEHVVAGQVIARIDQRDYRAALEQAEAQIAAAQATVRNADAQMDAQQAQINANQAH
jgi:membrane fusion protein, multidrug efflux system